jgi:UDP-3-O-[3-hydroxymyristoyl] N-acetylglucosamine deacetylase/3-hydroxyacyl-[acyl-carrier-protein] dehydratase
VTATDRQTTLAGEARYEGFGLHTGERCRVVFLPAPPNTGVVFVRADMPGRPEVKVAAENATYDADQGRRTILRSGNAEVHTVEHLLAAVRCMGIDNLRIEIDAREPGEPGDGSAGPYVDLIRATGIQEQDAPRVYFEIPHEVRLTRGNAELIALPHPSLRVSFTIEYDNPVIGTRHVVFDVVPEVFAREIAPARTFVLRRDVDALRKAGLIQGGSLGNAVVVEETGVANAEGLRFPDEFARHKVLDLLGDLALLGRPVRGHILAWRSGHESHVEFVKALAEAERRALGFDLPPRPDGKDHFWDIEAIAQIMPHRYPFLLVDRILELTDDRVVGIKNVTLNEPFFMGHFPDHPIMPAVLIVEAMAQTGGVLLLNKVERPKEKLVYFMGIDRAKFRRPVKPGDQLRFELDLVKLKGRICKMMGKAFVDGTLVAEAELLSTVVDR